MIMDTNIQVKDVMGKLRSSGSTINVTEYKKVGWLQDGQTLVGIMRVFIVWDLEAFHIHETVRLFGEGEGVILWYGFNCLKTGPNVQIL
jgi:hypothetical protein